LNKRRKWKKENKSAWCGGG